VEAGSTRLLFDAGISGKKVKTRMAARGYSPKDVDALFITHEHGDHIRSAGIFQRMFQLPVYMTEATFRANSCDLGRLHDVRYFKSGESVTVKDAVVYSISTPHDATDSVSYVVEFEGRRLGIFTDLGHPFSSLNSLLESVDAAYLESNYDPHMLETGPYPAFLKRRIAGKGGHISNEESATLLQRSLSKKHQWIALAHLSEQNNTPQMALQTHHREVSKSFPFLVASRYEASPPWEV